MGCLGSSILLVLGAVSLFGQAGTGELFGTVLDASGAAVPIATVSALSRATGVEFRALSNERGDYHLLGLPAGEYSLTVERPGFRMYRQSGIALRAGDQTAFNVTMAVGMASRMAMSKTSEVTRAV